MQLLLTDVFRTPEVWVALGLSMPEDSDVARLDDAAAETLRYAMQALGWRAQDVSVKDASAVRFDPPGQAPDIALLVELLRQVSAHRNQRSAMSVAASRAHLETRASSSVRAAAEMTAHDFRQGFGRETVVVAGTARPYLDYFGMEEQHIRFPKFNGEMSETVKRAAFVSGDAVTVLPYDPRRDRVLVIEQFRFAPFVRGDRHPWSLEPVAGRIDAGETPEEAVRREMREEVSLDLGALHHIGSYYPSPGAVTEYLYSYIGIADLADEAAGIGGLEDEAEDIRGMLLSFDELMALVSSSEAQNGPLILSALWLAAHRLELASGT